MGVRIASGASFVAAVERADDVDLVASSLARGKNGVLAALEAAAAHGARVRVRLEASPYDPSGKGGQARANASTIAQLRAHGIDASLVDEQPAAPLHLKAAIVDGRLFLDDRNWLADGRDTIVETADPADISAVRAAMRGEHAGSSGVAVRKREALELEADTIRRAAGDGVAVESESFGSGVVAAALLERAKTGEAVRLLVSARDMHGEREAEVLRSLNTAGVQIRVESGVRDEKLCIAGKCAWIGSANATTGFPDTVDWGTCSRARAVVGALRETFERNWATARPYAGGISKPVGHGV